jgi:hypothetical protein
MGTFNRGDRVKVIPYHGWGEVIAEDPKDSRLLVLLQRRDFSPTQWARIIKKPEPKGYEGWLGRVGRATEFRYLKFSESALEVVEQVSLHEAQVLPMVYPGTLIRSHRFKGSRITYIIDKVIGTKVHYYDPQIPSNNFWTSLRSIFRFFDILDSDQEVEDTTQGE